MMDFNIDKIRADFPTLCVKVHGKSLVYLDNAATTHKPVSVIDSIESFYRNYNSNIHRGVHKLSQLATDAYENSREKIRKFINAEHFEEIVYTKGATEPLTLLVSS